MVALETAARIPERIKTVILEDPPFSTMGNRLSGTSLMSYFQGVEAVVRGEVIDSAAHLNTTDLNSTSFEARVQRLYEAFSNIAVGIGGDGRIIRVCDQRDAISRRFSAEGLARIDPEVLAPITAGKWLDGYDLDRLLPLIRSRVVLLRADAACGGMLTADEADFIGRRLDGLCEQIYFSGIGHSMHWAKPNELTEIIISHN
jgi:pimeloyl-ACP methyl ester carboxylesterase